jgi:two-component system sensor histidine kinase KdpD
MSEVVNPAAVSPPAAAGFPRSGHLRIYLGAAPGVGKTYAMLNEGRRRKERGTDVVVGYVETHGRQRTAEQIGDLEVVPRRSVEHRGRRFQEMDVDAILLRRPEQVLVDELAHTNMPGSRNEKRWQDIDALLDAGIDVISTVNIQHLESLNDVVERITGIRQQETVPDHVVRAADQIELVDMDPEALRRRLAHGNVYAAEKIDAALANYFREGNLSALRELALMWVADRVDDELQDYRERHGITRPWETRERVVVALSGAPGGEHLIRRGARIAQRAKGELVGVHVLADTGLASARPEASATALAEQRRLIEELGGEYRRMTSNDVAAALVDLARAENATQIVLGASDRSRWQELINGSVINRVVRRSGFIDVHVISRPAATDGDSGDETAARRLPVVKPVLVPLSPRRQLWGWVIAATGLPLLTLVFANMRETFGLPSVLLLYLVLAMVVALVGGAIPAVAAVVGGFLLANWFFTPPLYDLTIASAENLLALVVYAAAAGIVAVLVDRVGRTRLQAGRARAEAEALAALAGALVRPGSLNEMLGQLRSTFGFRAAALLRRDGPRWETLATSGPDPPTEPDRSAVARELGRGISLALAGGQLSAGDERVLNAFAAQVAMVAEAERLHREADKATELAAANSLRAALLQAVSHDLRTPLASIKASISSLRQRDIEWPPEVTDDFHATIDEETDRLTNLVGNLLDMSRLQASALTVDVRPTGVEEIVLAAVASLGRAATSTRVDVPETLPEVAADGALLERAFANLISNAARVSPPDAPPRVTAGVVGGEGLRVDTRVIDRGPGIRPADRELVFLPFQRVVDHQADGTGVGLGLAIARGFVEAMGGELSVDDTPGGGVTMVVSLPVAGRAVQAAAT